MEESLKKIRHTTSHVMAQAVKRLWPNAKLAIGPAIENGFYYDFDVDHHFSDEDLRIIEKEMESIIQEDLKLKPEFISRETALNFFKNEPYKVELINAIPEDKKISIYRQGDFFDLCAGPHVSSTGEIKAFKLLNIAGAYWRGDEHNKMLQRIYGTAFYSKKELDDYLLMVKEAAESDHRKLGHENAIFALSNESPGMSFFLPAGMAIMNTLLNYWRELHSKYGYKEIRTPLILKRHLWETSGHWKHYSQGMYTLQIDEEDYAIKPMNCPGAIESFRELQRNFRGNSEEFGLFSGILADSAANGAQTAQKVPSKAQGADEAPTTGIAPTGIAGMRLPVRLAEIGLVHRAERSGQLHGLMRVREFTQDDAHIFCLMPQVQAEILRVLRLMDEVYTVLGLRYELELSTRPADRIGADEVWDAAEDALKGALEAGGRAWKVNEGDGAFYGPKIDVHVKDRMGRSWQCGTIQMDFNLPERFDLWVNDGERKVRPVMLHRVIYGSIERFIGILTEHFKGRFPLWLAPKQVRVIPLKSEFEDYARQVGERLTAAGLRVDGDFRDETVRKRVKVATLDLVPYTVVIGAKEAAGGDLHIKRLGGEDFELPLGYFVKFVEKKVASKALTY